MGIWLYIHQLLFKRKEVFRTSLARGAKSCDGWLRPEALTITITIPVILKMFVIVTIISIIVIIMDLHPTTRSASEALARPPVASAASLADRIVG